MKKLEKTAKKLRAFQGLTSQQLYGKSIFFPASFIARGRASLTNAEIRIRKRRSWASIHRGSKEPDHQPALIAFMASLISKT